MAFKQPEFSSPENQPEETLHPETNEASESSLDKSEQLLKEALKRRVQEALNGLGENIEAQREQEEVEALTKELSPEDHVGQLAQATLGKEWNDRRNDGVLIQKEVEAILNTTLEEMKKRGLGFERSPFNR